MDDNLSLWQRTKLFIASHQIEAILVIGFIATLAFIF